MQKLLSSLGDYFESRSIKAYLVGGCVRDRLLGNAVKDYDIMLETDIVALFKEMYQEQDFICSIEKPLIFKRYKTAKISFIDGEQKFELDFSSARSESYSEIAARPICSFDVSLRQDLERRDFSINAMASSLAQPDILIDYLGGKKDLKEKKIRVLHEKSFRDDPVRIIRAYKFLTRLSFDLDLKTKDLIIDAVKNNYAKFLNPKRSRDELLKVLTEQNWHEVLYKLEQIKVLKQFNQQVSELVLSEEKQADTYLKALST